MNADALKVTHQLSNALVSVVYVADAALKRTNPGHDQTLVGVIERLRAIANEGLRLTKTGKPPSVFNTKLATGGK